ncbi:hypothetical protein AMS58_20960 [Pseudoalteromonas porphyrae]|uniref:hypothetical protein n=1 Tax=Pseudoalteromonas TaxID=53246 RepID=UPI0006BAC87F|nr:MULTISPECIES: hypothetical protein [Pseudoalteromonas]KPH91952.1 hypothetical protein AMS58_20960 [Pseudoalteromonas porphyrae]
MEYDRWGNIISAELTGNGTTSKNSIEGVRWTKSDFDNNGFYPLRLFNSQLGHQIVAMTLSEHHPMTGAPQKIIDANGVASHNRKNWFGISTKQWAESNDTLAAAALHTGYLWCTNESANCIDNEVFVVTQVQDGQPEIRRYFDALSREVRVEKTTHNGRIITSNSSFDSKGNLVHVVAPHFLNEMK